MSTAFEHARAPAQTATTSPAPSNSAPVQAGLGSPGEHEADLIAAARPLAAAPLPVSQPDDASERDAERFAESSDPAATDGREILRSPYAHAPRAAFDAIASTGRPLAGHERAPALGIDLSAVQVHTGSLATESARILSAAAYTIGDHVVLGDGLDTRTAAGRRLLTHELAHVAQERRSVRPTALHRQGTVRRRPSTTKAPAEDVAQKVERVWESLGSFSKRAPDTVSTTWDRVQQYTAAYDRAFKAVSAKLAEEQRKEAERAKWMEVLTGILVGTGIGFGAARLVKACKVIHEAIEESKLLELGYETASHTVIAGGEGATERAKEAVVGEPAEFKLPPDLEANKVARDLYKQVADASIEVNKTQSAWVDVSPIRDQIRSHTPPKAKGIGGWLDRVGAAVAAADRALAQFQSTVDTPLLWRSEGEIEQDLWIRWMAESSKNAERMGLEEPGVRARLIPGRWQEAEAVDLAREEVERLNLIGRLGVVVVPPRATKPWKQDESFPGVIHLRHDAYTAAGRIEPPAAEPESFPGRVSQAATGGEPFAKIAWEENIYLRTGEVVLITRTTPRGVLAERFGTSPGKSLRVSEGERSWAFGMLGIAKPSYYHPEAGAILDDAVESAIGQLNSTTPRAAGHAGEAYEPRLEATETEDGVVVTDHETGRYAGEAGQRKPGTKIVLFSPLTSELSSNHLQVAEERRRRAGVFKVVAIDLDVDPLRMDKQEEIRKPGVVITSVKDLNITNEVLDVMIKGPH